MKPGPKAAVESLPKVLTLLSPPRRATEWLAEIVLTEGWCQTSDEADEMAERWAEQFLAYLSTEIGELGRVGRVSIAVLNSSSPYMVQGSAFIEPHDDQDVRDAKVRRGRFADYATVIAGVSKEQFECVCRGILDALRVENVQLTRRTADEGIDFFGELRLDQLLVPEARFPTWEAQLKVWMVGQAKHYEVGQASTPVIRELVGSVELAKSRAYSTGEDKYPDLLIRACDPVVYLFFTTGSFSSYAWRLLDRSGVVGMDGGMVAAFLADRGIGIRDEQFDEDEFMSWLEHY
jgi:hypothetical protein